MVLPDPGYARLRAAFRTRSARSAKGVQSCLTHGPRFGKIPQHESARDKPAQNCVTGSSLPDGMLRAVRNASCGSRWNHEMRS